LVIEDIALLVLACALIVVTVASLFAYVVYSAKLRKTGPIGASVLFAFGCIVWLIPVGMFYLYMPPWNKPLPNHAMQLNLDICVLVGIMLILGGMTIEVLSALAKAGMNFKTLSTRDLYVWFAQVAAAIFLNYVVSLASDPLLREVPGLAAQRLRFWWIGIVAIVVFMAHLSLAARVRYKEHMRLSAEATPQATKSLDTSA
jgi:hypothetical protein